MAWFVRLTRFGDAHLVYGQEAGKSCGIASLMMCVYKVNKLTPGATMLTVERDIYKAYEAASGGQAYSPEAVGTWGDRLATILTTFTSGNWRWHRTPPGDVAQTLIDKVGVSTGLGPVVGVNPVILGVDWDQGGAHWVVVDTVRQVLGRQYATICDPWDADVHVQPFSTGGPFLYDAAATAGLRVNLWGSSIDQIRKQPYVGNAAKGQVKTWGMIYRD